MVDLIGKRNYFFALSIVIIIAGVIGWFAHGGLNGGFNLDIQFQGGTIMEIEMSDDKFDTDKAANIVESTIHKKVSAQKSHTLNTSDSSKSMDLLVLNIAQSLTGEEQNKLVDSLRKDFNVKPDAQMNVQNVDPFIGNEIKVNGMRAVAIMSVLIVIYIWIRFSVMSGLSAGVMAVIGLLHDAAIMLSVYTIFAIPLNESFIAAVLTILGYSMSDTIIIYDRIRENSNLLKRVPIAELVNKSIMQTLARSINTVLTVLISITTVFVFAKVYNINSIAEFSFPLIIGIASGCYSSIFVASPLYVIWKQSQSKKKVTAKPVKA